VVATQRREIRTSLYNQGDRFLSHHRMLLFAQHLIHYAGRPGIVAAVMFAFVLALPGQGASAKAPALASVVFDTSVYATPEFNGEKIGVLPAGSEAELTGDAAPGFLAVYYGDTVGWVPAQYLSFGVRPGIDTAETLVDTPLLDAPMRDADVVATVPKGETVILTGAHVDGYDAASHQGAGGWLDDRDIAR
jgi:hypothetical protein